MDRIELAVCGVVRIEYEGSKTGRPIYIKEVREDLLKVDVRRKRLAGLIQDIKIAVFVVDEETRRRVGSAGRLRAQTVRPPQLVREVDRGWICAGCRARQGQFRIIL